MKRWTVEEEQFLTKYYPLYGKQYCQEKLKRSEGSVRKKASILGLKVIDAGLTQRLNCYNAYIDKLKLTQYECLEDFSAYTGNSGKLLHRHKLCGTEWRVSPNNISKLSGCPGCSKSGFKLSQKTCLYFIYFNEIDLYKIGITSNWDRRKSSFGYSPEVITLDIFQTGEEALLEEALLKNKLKSYLYNSGILANGNTETFKWPN